MAMYEFSIDEKVAILSMNNGENRFNTETVKRFTDTLNQIEENPQVNALVVTSAHEKIWCNGIDLDWMIATFQKEGERAGNRFLADMYTMFRRLLTMSMPTVAAINGHAFAGGAFLAFSHDFRFMREDRGWICLPEVDLGIPLGPVFMAITRHTVPGFLLHDMQYSARRLTARECEGYHIVRKACALDRLLPEAVAFAKSLNKGREIIGRMKQETLAPVLRVIDETLSSIQSSL